MCMEKLSVKLRKRTLQSDVETLYLDYYHKGKRTYESLSLYLSPDKKDKMKNKDTLAFAERIRAKREEEFRNDIFGFQEKSQHVSLIGVYNAYITTREDKNSKYYYRRMFDFFGEDRLVKQISTYNCQQYKQYLLTQLSNNGATTYFTAFKSLLTFAQNKGVIQINPAKEIKSSKIEVVKNYLTTDEIKALAATPYPNTMYKDYYRAFLFACFTGLRISDLRALQWEQIQQFGEFTRIIFKQKKTKGQEYIDINEQAVSILGERGKGRVFNIPYYNKNEHIRQWARKAGISKHITFHSSRHTFAVMMLNCDVDLYTVSKLLGHRSIQTTQVYAKVVDKRKQEAIKRIPKLI